MAITKNWAIALDNITVLNAEEDDFFSNGDEPYFVNIGFRAKLGVSGSAQTIWNGFLNDKWAAGITGGQTRAIPAAMGRVEFPGVTMLDVLAMTQLIGKPKPETPRPEIIGVVSLAFESDSTPFSAISSKMNEVRNAISGALTDIIANNTTPIGKLTAAQLQGSVKMASDALSAKLTPTIWEAVSLFLQSFTDPDDFVGLRIRWFTNVMPEVVACFQKIKEQKDASNGVQLPADQSDAALIARSGLNPLRPLGLSLTYKSSGVHYVASGKVVEF